MVKPFEITGVICGAEEVGVSVPETALSGLETSVPTEGTVAVDDDSTVVVGTGVDLMNKKNNFSAR